MTTYARKINNQAVDVTMSDPATSFHSTLAAQFIVIPDGTENGAIWNGISWLNPIPTISPEQEIIYSPLTAGQFYNCFTATEMIAIKGSADQFVKEFLARWQVAMQANENVNPNLISVQEGLAYLSVTNQLPSVTPPATYILPARIPQILSGVPQ